jgi:hypothetical protein
MNPMAGRLDPTTAARDEGDGGAGAWRVRANSREDMRADSREEAGGGARCTREKLERDGDEQLGRMGRPRQERGRAHGAVPCPTLSPLASLRSDKFFFANCSLQSLNINAYSHQ